MAATLLHGDSAVLLRDLPDNSVDAVVTDPPAAVSFMGREWDGDRGGRKQWIAWLESIMREAYRALKPGGHTLVWALPRTSHWAAFALEDAGFEIRDCVTHLFGSGFPKNHDISKALDKMLGAERGKVKVAPRPATSGTMMATMDSRPWVEKSREQGFHEVADQNPITDLAKKWLGWGTALKPAVEFWWLCRKPLSEKTLAANVARWGTGGINIGGSRVGTASTLQFSTGTRIKRSVYGSFNSDTNAGVLMGSASGRWPSNLLLSHSLFCEPGACAAGCPVMEIDEQSGFSESTASMHKTGTAKFKEKYNNGDLYVERENQLRGHEDRGGASRFFPTFEPGQDGELDELGAIFRYLAKPAQTERNKGCDDLPTRLKVFNGQASESSKDVKPVEERFTTEARNFHPTVKSRALMSFLCKLITPPGGLVLDPFMGSGSTGVAAVLDNFEFIGIEQETDYFQIAQARIRWARAEDGLFSLDGGGQQ
jgi:DNA modification methylase